VQISDAGKAAQSSEASAIQDSIDAVENDPRLRLIRAMMAMLTGQEVRVFDASTLQSDALPPAVQDPDQAHQPPARTAEQPAGYGVEQDRHESYSENEQTSFAASGVVHTTDGVNGGQEARKSGGDAPGAPPVTVLRRTPVGF
jgi:hypothetical protein